MVDHRGLVERGTGAALDRRQASTISSPVGRGGPMNPAHQLHQAGQSLWLDSISRSLLSSGTLARYIDELAVTGLTSNPTILGHAMAASTEYDDSLRHHIAAGVTDPQDLVYAVALEDLTAAADAFRPIWDATAGADGYVSVEVPPGLAYDARGSIELARRLHHQANRPNAFGESLQRQGARPFPADGATLLEAISAKTNQLLAPGVAADRAGRG